MTRKATNHIVIHCAATRPSQDVGVREIRQWHRARGFADIGYHYVIRRSGKVETGRGIDEIGAHVQGHNADSVGICLVGGIGDNSWRPANNFTPQQWEALKRLLVTLCKRYPKAKVLGHRDFPGVRKACPSFAAKTWAKRNGFPI